MDIINPYRIRQVADRLKIRFKSSTPRESPVDGYVRGFPRKFQGRWLPTEAAAGHRRRCRGAGAEAVAGYQGRAFFDPRGKRFRPQTSTPAAIRTMLTRMEGICGLKVGALISNSHLWTRPPGGLRFRTGTVFAAGEALGLPAFTAGEAGALRRNEKDFKSEGIPVFPSIFRHMMSPWEEARCGQANRSVTETDF